jgi:PilZ domain
MITIERRKSLRYKFEANLAITWGGTILSGLVREISAEGMFVEMFVEMSNPLWIGSAFSAHMELIKPIQLDCVVQWVEPGRGMGVSISLPAEEGRKHFAAILDTLSRG